ncbi:hypothetical protein BJ912DRAFT_1060566 [Pholiota molesta]|nr:hypothetical protein BJ912DRAFT_1060566 [Pholiota molesta]
MYKVKGVTKKIETTWNFRPSDEEKPEHSPDPVRWTARCNPAKEDTCGLCTEGISLDRQIHEAEEALATLKAKRASNNTKINTRHDPLSRLPIELVSEIFMYLRPLPMKVAYYLDVDVPDDVGKSMKTPLLLGAVCRAWRAFSWSIPRLWSTISINVYNGNEEVPDIIRQWLGRSGQLPLCIYLYAAQKQLNGGILSAHPYGNEPYVARLMDTINKYSGRWFYLNLDIPKRFILRVHCSGSEAPMLETLSLKMHTYGIEDGYLDSHERIEIGAIPNLRRIHLSPTVRFADIDMDWASVVHAEISDSTLEMCCDLLRQAPILTHLTLQQIDEDTFDLPSSIVRHQSLVSLHINGYGEDEGADRLLLFLDLPALEDFGIFASSKSSLNNITAFLRRSSCTLKKFRVHIDDTWMEHKRELIRVLGEMPHLEILDIECRYHQSDDDSPIDSQLPTPVVIQEMNSINERLFLPNLERVHIKVGFHPMDDSYFLDLLFHPDSPNITSPQRSEHSQFVPSDTLRLKPLHIYYLLDMATHRALHSMIISSFEIKSCTKDLNPFIDFLQQFLSCHVYDEGVRLTD